MTSLQELTRCGADLDALTRVAPLERPDLDCGGVLQVGSITSKPGEYIINANLVRAAKVCPHCGSSALKMHGRFLMKLNDLPYVDANQVPSTVMYSITAQRYQCDACNRGVAEALPQSLGPAVTNSKITRRLSCWLLYMLQTTTPYEHTARMAGYSTVWLRKWYTEVSAIFGLGAKPSKPGRHRIAKGAAD